jgi:hypothetical protein
LTPAGDGGAVNGSAKWPRRRRLGVYAVALGLWLSGVAWLVFHYFLATEGPFGARPHPLEAWWLALHGALGFVSLWTLGLLWGVHVAQAWPLRRKRWSGITLLAGAGLLVGSGYLLYYAGNDVLRADAALLHWGLGLACPALFLAHRFARRAVVVVRAPSVTVSGGTPAAR